MSTFYRQSYSDGKFRDKALRHARNLGATGIENALKMYYAARDPDTPKWAKGTIFGALGYFISPLDAIPDLTPIPGYSDDITVIAAALAAVASSIKEEHREKARTALEKWFGKDTGSTVPPEDF